MATRVTREHIVGILRASGLSEAAGDAERELPDEVEYQQAEEYLGRYGITKNELISRCPLSLHRQIPALRGRESP